MRIDQINSYYNSFYKPSFCVNLNSSKLRFKEDDFYVRIHGYGRHSGWAKKIKETADLAVKFIREKCDYEETLKKITNGVIEANQLLLDIEKRKHTGILRICRDGWHYGSDWSNFSLITRYRKFGNNKYKTYAERLDYVVKHPLENPYEDIILTRPVHDKDYGKFINHGNYRYINNALNRVNKIYDDLYEKYILKEVQKNDLDEVHHSVAEIRWILAHATPWERGSDAISNTFIRSIYKAMGIKTYPLKKGVSLDLEAYCTNLNDYKKNFVSYFSKKPEIVE